jgi:hypothetical protein
MSLSAGHSFASPHFVPYSDPESNVLLLEKCCSEIGLQVGTTLSIKVGACPRLLRNLLQ